jgi:hypothetical protein
MLCAEKTQVISIITALSDNFVGTDTFFGP